MGFKPPSQKYRLEFAEGHELHGLEVVVKQGSMGLVIRMSKLAGLQGDTELTPESADVIDSAFGAFADVLVEWNMERDDGTPIPTTKDGMYELDIEIISKLMSAWSEKVAGVSAPLDSGSDNGQISAPVPPMPMETLSSSLVN